MEINKSLQCRICLQISDDIVNMFEIFENTTIASILTQHFWFPICEGDGISEHICQICWINTKTFHIFYKRIEFLQKEYWDSVNAAGSTLIKQELSDSPLEPELNVSKCDEAEPLVPVIIKEETSDDGSSSEPSENSQISEVLDVEERPSEEPPIEKQKVIAVGDQNVTEKKQRGGCKKKKREKLLNEPERIKVQEEDATIRQYFTMECDACSEPLETFKHAKKHYRTVHKVLGYLRCCGKKFVRRGAVLNHIFYHLNPEAFRCGQCDKQFADKVALRKHVNEIHLTDSSVYKCDLCPKSFKWDSRLTAHKESMHSTVDEKLPCDKCNKTFASKLKLTYHRRQVHEFKTLHICDICAREFKHKQILTNHMLVHSTSTQLKVQCNVCGARFSHELRLRKHQRIHKEETTNLHCPICNKLVRKKRALRAHIREVHGEKNYPCTICEKKFNAPTRLKEHLAVHTGQDLYKCTYCTKTFKSSGNLCNHRKKEHFEEWSRDSKKYARLLAKSNLLAE